METFHVGACGAASLLELIQASGDAYIDPRILADWSPAPRLVLPRRQVVLWELASCQNTQYVHEQIAHLSFEPVEWEYAFLFGLSFPTEQLKSPIAFLHNPWMSKSGFENTLLLGRDGDRRGIYLNCSNSWKYWATPIRFAFFPPARPQ